MKTSSAKLAANRAWRQRNADKLKEYYRKRQATPERKEYDRIRSYERRYGITREQFLQMAAAQQGRCALCGVDEKQHLSRWGTLCVDHDHATQRVRMLLCAQCNKGLGSFNDDPVLMEKAADYVRRFR